MWTQDVDWILIHEFLVARIGFKNIGPTHSELFMYKHEGAMLYCTLLLAFGLH